MLWMVVLLAWLVATLSVDSPVVIYKGKPVHIVKVVYLDKVGVAYNGRTYPAVLQYKIEAVDGSWDNYVYPKELTFS